MGTSNYSDEFKRDAVHQFTVRGVSSSGGFPAVGGQHAFAVQVDEAVRWSFADEARDGP